MVLIRAALSKILPHEDLVLSLDVDTIVDKNIDELWDLPMEKYYIAAVREPAKSTGSYIYINFGVCLMNLKLLRSTGKDDEII
jgi:lipopolysaccharide biosynthesis glycosyltransferase